MSLKTAGSSLRPATNRPRVKEGERPCKNGLFHASLGEEVGSDYGAKPQKNYTEPGGRKKTLNGYQRPTGDGRNPIASNWVSRPGD